MTGEEFRVALERLQLNQAAFADYTQTSRRAVSNWIKHGPPYSIELLLQWMQRAYVPPAPPAQEQEFAVVREALAPAITSAIARAYRAGYSPTFIAPVLKSVAEEYRDLIEQARGLIEFHDAYSDTSGTIPVRGRGRPKSSSNT